MKEAVGEPSVKLATKTAETDNDNEHKCSICLAVAHRLQTTLEVR